MRIQTKKGTPRRPEFNRALLAWYRRHGRTLPWRNIRDPYRILLSEIMLQQTQVNRVLEKYPLFLKRFPTIHKLARARQRSVLLAWQGMGYNNRAVRLHKLAKTLVVHHGGRFPSDIDELLDLPGVGKYTAHAILASVYRRVVPAIDVNVSRVLSRVFWRMRSTEEHQHEQRVWKLAHDLIAHRTAYQWNQAMMDLGSSICTARKPRCHSCPAMRYCQSSAGMTEPQRFASRREPSLRGIPNRIFRGRIIEVLRTHPGSIPVHTLQRRITPRGGTARWWKRILSGLERDGLIKTSGSGILASRKVELA